MSASFPPRHRADSPNLPAARAEYTTREVADLLDLDLGEVLGMIARGEIEAEQRRKRRQLGGYRQSLIAWEALASIALVRWTVLQIHDALRKHADHVLPRLLRPTEMSSIRLPQYQVQHLEALALRHGVTVETYLYEAMLDLEAAEPREEIERLLPGFTEAMRFPEKTTSEMGRRRNDSMSDEQTDTQEVVPRIGDVQK